MYQELVLLGSSVLMETDVQQTCTMKNVGHTVHISVEKPPKIVIMRSVSVVASATMVSFWNLTSFLLNAYLDPNVLVMPVLNLFMRKSCCNMLDTGTGGKQSH